MIMRVLVLDNDENFAKQLQSAVLWLNRHYLAKRVEMDVDAVFDIASAHAAIIRNSYDIAFVDGILSSTDAFDDGIDFAKYLRAEYPEMTIVVVSAYPACLDAARVEGIEYVLAKSHVPIRGFYDRLRSILDGISYASEGGS